MPSTQKRPDESGRCRHDCLRHVLLAQFQAFMDLAAPWPTGYQLSARDGGAVKAAVAFSPRLRGD